MANPSRISGSLNEDEDTQPTTVPGSTADDYAAPDTAADTYEPWTADTGDDFATPAPEAPSMPAIDYGNPDALQSNLGKIASYDNALEGYNQRLIQQKKRANNAEARRVSAETGAKFQTDASGVARPVINPDTGKQKYRSGETGVKYDAQGKAYKVRTNEAGERVVFDPDDEEPDFGENPNDPNDGQLYKRNKYRPWEAIDPEEGLKSQDRRVMAASARFLHKREVNQLETQRADIGLRLRDPAKPKPLTDKQREELTLSITGLQEPEPEPAPVTGFMGFGTNGPATAEAKTQWQTAEADRQARLQAAQAALAGDDERRTLEQQDYDLALTLQKAKTGGAAGYLARRRQEQTVLPPEQAPMPTAEEEIAVTAETIAQTQQDVQGRMAAIADEMRRGVSSERADELNAERSELSSQWWDSLDAEGQLSAQVTQIDAGAQDRQNAERTRIAEQRAELRKTPAFAPYVDQLDALDQDIETRRAEAQAITDPAAREAAIGAIKAESEERLKTIQSEMGVVARGGFPKTSKPKEWDKADQSAWEKLSQEQKREFIEVSNQKGILDEVVKGRREIADREFEQPSDWATLPKAEQQRKLKEFQEGKDAYLAGYDREQSQISPERASIIKELAGDKQGTFGKQLDDQLTRRITTAASAAGSALSSVGTGPLDLATAAQAAFGAKPDDTWTRQVSSAIKDFYDRGMDDEFRDAAATKITSGLASALSFLAPGGVIGKAMGGGAKAIRAASAISGAVMNGGQAYAEALDMGMTSEQAFQRLAVGFGLGATEAVGVGGILAKLDKLGKGSLSKFFKNLVTQGLEEGAQEAFQSAGQDVADLLILGGDDERTKSLEQIKKDAIENGLWGAATGVLFTGLVDAAQRRDLRNAGLPEDGTPAATPAATFRPEQLAAVSTQIDNYAPMGSDPASIDTSKKAARAALKLIQGAPQNSLLAEETAALKSKLPDGSPRMEMVEGTPVLTDGQIAELHAIAPEAQKLPIRDEESLRLELIQKANESKTPQQGLPPSAPGTNPGASGTDSSKTQNPAGQGVEPPIARAEYRSLTAGETKKAKGLSAVLRNAGATPEAAEAFSRHFLRTEQGTEEFESQRTRIVEQFNAAGGKARSADIQRAVESQEGLAGETEEAILSEATTAYEKDTGKKLSEKQTKALKAAVTRIAPAVARWNNAFSKVTWQGRKIGNESGGAGVLNGGLIFTVRDLIRPGNLGALVRNPERAEKILQEEAIHHLGIKVLADRARSNGVKVDGREERAIADEYVGNLWSALPLGVRRQVQFIYSDAPGTMHPSSLGHEFLRMLVQGDLAIENGQVKQGGAVLTEETINQTTLKLIRDYIRDLLSYFSQLSENLRRDKVDEKTIAEIDEIRTRLRETIKSLKKQADQSQDAAYGAEYGRRALGANTAGTGQPGSAGMDGQVSERGNAPGPRVTDDADGKGAVGSPAPEPASPESGSGAPVSGSENAPRPAATGSELDEKAAEAHPTPTPAQKEAGNYRKGHIRISGLDISIENPVGSVRSGTDGNGKKWEVTLKAHYGYIKGTEGKDGDHLDVLVKEGTPADWAGTVYVINQIRPGNGHFDEHKIVIGARSRLEASKIYLGNYAKGWKGLGSMVEMPMGQFKGWIETADHTKPAKEGGGVISARSAKLGPATLDQELARLERDSQELQDRVQRNAAREPGVQQSDRDQNPIRRGKQALLDRLNRELSHHKIPENDGAAMRRFIADIREDLISDVALTIRQRGEGGQGSFEFGASIVRLFREQIEKSATGFDDTFIHEIWHALSRYLTPQEVAAVRRQYLKEQATYLQKNPWFKPFIGRWRLTPEQYTDWRKFTDQATANRNTRPIKEADGTITGYTLRFSAENYRFRDVDEWFAETLKDRTVDRYAEMEGPVQSVFALSKRLMVSIGKAIKALFKPDAAQPIFNRLMGGYAATIQRNRPLDNGEIEPNGAERFMNVRDEFTLSQIEVDSEKTAAERFRSFLAEAERIADNFANIPGATQAERKQEARLALRDAARGYNSASGRPFEVYARTAVNNRLRTLFRREVRQSSRFPTTLDTPIEEGQPETRGELIADQTAAPTSEVAALAESRRLLDQIISELPNKMQRVVQGYYGFETGPELARELGITKQGVDNLQQAAFRRMRGKLGERGVGDPEALLSRPAEDSENSDTEEGLDTLLKQLEADGYLDYGAMAGLQQQAASEVDGKRKTGRPDLAHGADNPDVMGVDAYYTAKFQPETEAKWETEAREMLAKDPEGTRWSIEMAGLNNEALSPAQTKAAEVIAGELRNAMLKEGLSDAEKEAARRAFNVFWLAFRSTGTAAGRALAARHDPFKSKAQRYRDFLTDLMLKPRPEAQKKIDAEKDPVKKAALMDDETKALLEKLKKAGISPEDILKDRVYLSLANQSIINEFAALLSRAAKSGNAVRQQAFRMVLKNRAFAEIAKATGLTEPQVKQIKHDFMATMRRQHFDKFLAGAKADAKSLVSGTKVDAATAEKEFQKWLKNLGIVDDAKQGRPKFDIEDPAQVMRMARAIQSATRANVFDMAYEWWIMNILSGPQTHVVNIAGNTVSAAWDLSIQRSMEAMVNLVIRDSKAARLGEFRYLLKGLLPGISKGLSLGAKAWNAEHDFFEHTVLGTPLEIDSFDKAGNVQAAIPGKIGRLVRVPGRSLLFADSLFKTALGQAEASVQAYRMAKSEGLSGQKLSDRIALLTKTREQVILDNLSKAKPSDEMVEYFARELVRRDDTLNVDDLIKDTSSDAWQLAREQEAFDMAKAAGWTDAAWQSAVEKAKELTFQQDLKRATDGANAVEDAAAKLQDARGTNKLIGLFFPFVRTPYNIFRLGIRKSPFGSAALAANLAKGLYGMRQGQPYLTSHPEAVRDVAEQAIAWTAMLLLYGAAQGDDDDDRKGVLVTGSMPFNLVSRGQRELQQRAYGGDYTIRVGGRNGFVLHYGRYEPIATVLGTLVDTIRAIKRRGAPADNMDALWGYFVAQAQSKTFLQGFSDVVKGFDANASVGEGAQKFLFQALVPNIVRQPLRNLDDYARDGKHAEMLYTAFPTGSLAEPKTDVYGRDVMKDGNPLLRLVMTTPLKADAVLEKSDRLLLNWNRNNPSESWAPQTPTDTFKNKGEEVKMDAAQYRRYSVLAGKNLRDALKGRFTEAQIASPKKEDVDLIRTAVEKARADAKERIFAALK